MCFVIVVSRFRFLTILGCESRCLGLEQQGFRMRVLQKTTFKEVGILMISESIFDDFRWRWEPFWLWTLWRLALNLMLFHGYPEAPPDFAPLQV